MFTCRKEDQHSVAAFKSIDSCIYFSSNTESCGGFSCLKLKNQWGFQAESCKQDPLLPTFLIHRWEMLSFFFFLVQYFHTLISWKKVETVDVFGYIHEDQRDFFQGTNTFTLHSMKVDDPRVWNVPPSRNILPMSIRHHSYFCLCLPNIRIRKIPRREREDPGYSGCLIGNKTVLKLWSWHLHTDSSSTETPVSFVINRLELVHRPKDLNASTLNSHSDPNSFLSKNPLGDSQ